MIKVLRSPITKIFFILTGYVSLVSALWEASQSFRALFQSVFGNWILFGFIPSALLFALCMVALTLSVAMTMNSSHLKQEKIFILWRKTDGFLLIVFASWLASFLMFRVYSDVVRGNPGTIFLFTLAYLIGIVVITELTARVRDKEFRHSLYWVAFFQKHPIWQPLGLVMALLLTANLLFFLFLSPMVALLFRFRLSLVIGFPLTLAWNFIELESLLQITSALTLAGITYFMAVLLNLADQYDRANAEKIRSERFKSELITNVSHDIRTPLTSIINYVDLLKSEPIEGKPAEYISVLERKSARLKTLIDDLMDASKAGTGNISVALENVNLTELAGQVSGEFEEKFVQRNLTLVLREPDEPIFVYADSRHLWRTLENLFSNASKYALSGTRVFAEISRRKDDVVFTLKNTSQKPIDLSGDALSEQFIRGDVARESEGSGLGLYIAKSLVELMGGQFEIRISGDLFEVEIFCRK